MDDKEKIKAAITMLKRLKKMVGFFMKKDIAELIEKLEAPGTGSSHNEPKARGQEPRQAQSV